MDGIIAVPSLLMALSAIGLIFIMLTTGLTAKSLYRLVVDRRKSTEGRIIRKEEIIMFNFSHTENDDYFFTMANPALYIPVIGYLLRIKTAEIEFQEELDIYSAENYAEFDKVTVTYYKIFGLILFPHIQ